MASPEHPGSPSRVVALVPDASGDRIRLRLDDGTGLDVPPGTEELQGLSVGDPVDAPLRTRLEQASLEVEARDRALRLLSHRDRSREELARRLRRDGIPRPVLDRVLDGLRDRGLVDDARFARALVRERIARKPRGHRSLLAELRKRGVAAEVAGAAVDEVLHEEGASERSLALEAARGWLRRQGTGVRKALAAEPFSDDRERAVRRLTGYLGRRGFRGSVLYAAVEAVAEEAAAEAAKEGGEGEDADAG